MLLSTALLPVAHEPGLVCSSGRPQSGGGCSVAQLVIWLSFFRVRSSGGYGVKEWGFSLT